MKNFTNNWFQLLFAIVISVTMASCDKNTAGLMDDMDRHSAKVYATTFTEQGPLLPIPMAGDLTGTSSHVGSRAANSVHGGCSAFDGAMRFRISAGTNNSGVHGSVRIDGFLGGIEGDVSCLIVAGNHAVVGFLATASGTPGLVGQYVYIHVIDNGNGSSPTPDQVANTVYISSSSSCDLFCPSCVNWYGSGIIYADHGNISVN